MKVLVVDDDVDIAESTAMLLDLAGHEARVVLDAALIREQAMEFVPDVVLQDVNMPGLTDLRAVVADTRGLVPRAKIFLFTATPDGIDMVRPNGADGFIAKPFDFDAMLATITPG